MNADDFAATGRIEMRDLRNVDHKSSGSRLQSVKHTFAQAEKRRVKNHSSRDSNPDDVVADFRADFHRLNLI
jgi:hypothetical protein